VVAVGDRRRDVALFRYSLIREAADLELSNRERGQIVRHLAAREHVMPDGTRVRVGRSTLDRWIQRWRTGGFDAAKCRGVVCEASVSTVISSAVS
jgi:putative transposase